MKRRKVWEELEGYTLVITEKPDVAKRIALALDEYEKPRKRRDGIVSYYVAKRGVRIVIVPALGHLYTLLDLKENRRSYPEFDYSWRPLYEAEQHKGKSRSCIKVISKLAKNAETFVDACDYDVEGSIIGYNVLKFACGNKQTAARRMKYSTLTKNEIEQAYLNLMPTLDFSLIEAGLTRHEVDWLYGVNLSRALTAAATKNCVEYAAISAGRVQGPTLRFLAEREKSIRSFQPARYWSIAATAKFGRFNLKVEHEPKTFSTKEEAERVVESCEGKSGTISKIEQLEFTQAPLPPFDFTSLLCEAYKLFGYTPTQTSKISQQLYLNALISYPRTSSQKLPPKIDYSAILENLLKDVTHRENAKSLLAKQTLKPRYGRGEDTAHPAIYPSGNQPKGTIGKAEKELWNLIVRRFMAAFGDFATAIRTKVAFEIEGHRFDATEVKTVNEGWMRYYRPYVRPFSGHLPPMKEGECAKIEKIGVEEKCTRPPARYNASTILEKMQKEGIGTKSTRAGIIQTLYDRKFIRERNIEVTELGIAITDVLAANCPDVTSPKLTRILEKEMENIQKGRTTREEVVRDAIATLSPILDKLKLKEQEIGKQLGRALQITAFEDRAIGDCPICKNGRLLIIEAKKTGKRFIGCSQYFEGKCKASFPLPQQGSVSPNGACKLCSWPKIQILRRGRPGWNICLNTSCPGGNRRLK